MITGILTLTLTLTIMLTGTWTGMESVVALSFIYMFFYINLFGISRECTLSLAQYRALNYGSYDAD